MLAFAGFLALPPPAEAQTTVWSGSLEVASFFGFGSLAYGCDSLSENFCDDLLTPDEFTYNGATYTFDLLYSGGGFVDIDFNETLPDDANSWSLNFGSTVLAFADSTFARSTGRSWETVASWATGDTILLTITAAPPQPNRPPEFPADSATRSFQEDPSPHVMQLGDSFWATDPDSDTLTYSLEGTHAEFFDLVPQPLPPRPGAYIWTTDRYSYDHEAAWEYNVTVKADDGQGGTDTIAVTIFVTDRNEPPGAPGTPTVSGGIDSLSVSWTAPITTRRPPIESYDLQYRPGTTGDWTDGPQDVTETSATIMGLDANASYQVRVRATNDEGDGPWSPAGSGSTNAPANTPPEFPESIPDVSMPENSVPGLDIGDPVVATDADGDTLTYSLLQGGGTDGSSFDIVPSSGQLRTRSGVTYSYEEQKSFIVQVRVDDANGGTDGVLVQIELTDVEEPPLAPDPPTVSPVSGSSDSLSVSWTAPDNTGKPDIDSYDLQYRKGTSGPFTDGPQAVADTMATIGGLDANASYQVRVRATNDEGDGPWSPAGTGSTSADTTPPTLTSAYSGPGDFGEAVHLTFSEDLDLDNLPSASAFRLTADGSPVAINFAQIGNSDNEFVLLSLAPVIRMGQTVVVTYTDPTAGDDALGVCAAGDTAA